RRRLRPLEHLKIVTACAQKVLSCVSDARGSKNTETFLFWHTNECNQDLRDGANVTSDIERKPSRVEASKRGSEQVSLQEAFYRRASSPLAPALMRRTRAGISDKLPST